MAKDMVKFSRGAGNEDLSPIATMTVRNQQPSG